MKTRLSVLVFVLCFICTAIYADEGMWTYDHAPLKQLKERYGFAPPKAWLDHLRLSSIDISASASFVSKDGLILTNHHVALGSAQRLSTPERNLVSDGFVAKGIGEEIPIPGMTIQVLESIDDVTAAVEGSVKPGATPAEARAQKDAKVALMESECQKQSGKRGQVVALYGGAQYALYKYKEYTDIRLVFIPELQAAFFGGDDDNFTYPRYDLDVALLRAYENGKPAKIEHFLEVNPEGAKDGDLVFASGCPRETDRLMTYAMLEHLRDFSTPFTMEKMAEMRSVMKEYSARGDEEARRARTVLYFLENYIKSTEGEFGGLNDPKMMAKKLSQEEALRAAVDKDPKLKQEYGSAWKDIEASLVWEREHKKDIRYKMDVGWRNILATAVTMVRYGTEASKPDGDRLDGFHEAEIADVVRGIEAPAPVYRDLERVSLNYMLGEKFKGLGTDDFFIKTVFEGKQPDALVKEVLAGTKLDDGAFRKKLLEKKGKAILKSDDPMLVLARRIDPFLRDTEKAYRDNVQAVQEAALTKVAKAGFAAYGADTYPDATGTLRLSFGKIAGFPRNSTLVPAFTTLYGLFDRGYSFGEKGDFYIPKRIKEHEKELDLKTPYNFVCTADITGGNSGSPIVDRDGKLVGLVFDGNAESHPNAYVYDEYQARCVAVDIRGILEVVRKVYGAEWLYKEMAGE
jgi:hypothetical protein